jgi:hypothetical protein
MEVVLKRIVLLPFTLLARNKKLIQGGMIRLLDS